MVPERYLRAGWTMMPARLLTTSMCSSSKRMSSGMSSGTMSMAGRGGTSTATTSPSRSAADFLAGLSLRVTAAILMSFSTWFRLMPLSRFCRYLSSR